MAKCVEAGWALQFKRMLGETETSEWAELQCLLKGVTWTDSDDEISEALTTNKKFSTKSLYIFLTNGGILNILAQKNMEVQDVAEDQDLSLAS
jgi:hypothetical protein